MLNAWRPIPGLPGWSETSRWILECRNVAAGRHCADWNPAPAVKGLRLRIDSQPTGTTPESYFGEVAFRSTPL